MLLLATVSELLRGLPSPQKRSLRFSEIKQKVFFYKCLGYDASSLRFPDKKDNERKIKMPKRLKQRPNRDIEQADKGKDKDLKQ